MKVFTLMCAVCATVTLTCNAFAQSNAPASAKGLNTGDNVQDAPVHHSTHIKKSTSPKAGAAGPATELGGTAAPSGPGAPVSASGSGQ